MSEGVEVTLVGIGKLTGLVFWYFRRIKERKNSWGVG